MNFCCERATCSVMRGPSEWQASKTITTEILSRKVAGSTRELHRPAGLPAKRLCSIPVPGFAVLEHPTARETVSRLPQLGLRSETQDGTPFLWGTAYQGVLRGFTPHRDAATPYQIPNRTALEFAKRTDGPFLFCFRALLIFLRSFFLQAPLSL